MLTEPALFEVVPQPLAHLSILMAVALSSELIQPFKFGAAVWATETTQARGPFFNVTMTPPGLQAFLYSSRLPACGPWNL